MDLLLSRTPRPGSLPHGGVVSDAVSGWVRRWSDLVAPGADVLDVACGRGRHVRWFAARGCAVVALDRDAAALASLAEVATECVVADIEAAAWPLPGRRFDAVVVCNYLHRPLMPTLLESVAPGGLLIYETFGVLQATIGRPTNPDFLLRPGELPSLMGPLRVIAYEDGFDATGAGRYVQRIVAARPPGPDAPSMPDQARYALGVAPGATG